MATALIGKPAPAFSADSTFGRISLEQCRGRGVVLYFYPKDNTPGCTTETEGFRDAHDQFIATGCVLIGVSRDSLRSHENLSGKLTLPFPLIADTDEAVCTAYGVIKQKQKYGKQVRGIERSTFLTNADGKLVQAWRGIKAPGHVPEVLPAAASLT